MSLESALTVFLLTTMISLKKCFPKRSIFTFCSHFSLTMQLLQSMTPLPLMLRYCFIDHAPAFLNTVHIYDWVSHVWIFLWSNKWYSEGLAGASWIDRQFWCIHLIGGSSSNAIFTLMDAKFLQNLIFNPIFLKFLPLPHPKRENL